MQTKYTYLLIDVGAILIPLVFSRHPKIRFHLYRKEFWRSNMIVSLLFIIWDMIFTHFGVWSFNPKYVTGFYLGNLPFEEILFFYCIPYASLFTYHSLSNFSHAKPGYAKIVSILLGIALPILAISNYTKLYTVVTFLLLSGAIVYFAFILKTKWLSQFYLMYCIILVPFFIVNGLLTGMALSEPIVKYDDHENVGIRLFTIPLEDVFYGMLLLLVNTALYELFKQKKDPSLTAAVLKSVTQM